MQSTLAGHDVLGVGLELVGRDVLGPHAQRHRLLARRSHHVEAHRPARALRLQVRLAGRQVLGRLDPVRALRRRVPLQALLHQLDALHRDPENVAGQHREGGVVALAVDAGADRHRRGAVVVHLDGAVLDMETEGRGHLDVGGHADAQLEAVTGRPPALLLGPQLVVAGGGQRGIKGFGVLARVVGATRRSGERE